MIPASDVGKFDLLVDGNVEADDIGDSGTTGAVSVSAGKSNDPDPIGDTHTVGEAAGTNTDLSRYDTSISCTDGTDTVGPVAGIGPVDVFVEPDDAWVCTITNTLRQGTLIVKKQVINDNGGNATASDFTFSIDAGSAVSFDEAGGGSTDPLTGENSFQVDAGDYTVTEGVVSGYTASDNGNCSPATVVAGETTICEFTNDDDAPSLTLVKTVINDNGGTAAAGDWTLAAAGYDAVSPDAGTYDLSETGPVGYTLTSLTCDNAQGQVSSVTLGLGESVTCTFVNDDDAPSLTLVKEVTNDNGGTAVAGDWTLTAAGYDANNPQAGSYDLSETGPVGYTLTSLTCDNAQGQVSSVTLGLGESVTCTFVNDDLIDITLEIVKTFDPITVQVGESGTFTIAVTNLGPSTATDVLVTDLVDDALDVTGLALVPPAVGDCSASIGQSISCTVDILAGQTIEIIVDFVATAPFLPEDPVGEEGSQFIFVFANGSSLEGHSTGEVFYTDEFGETTQVDNGLTKNDYPFDIGGFTLHLSCSELFTGGWADNGGPNEFANPDWQVAFFSINRYNSGGLFKTCGGVVLPIEIPNTATATGTDDYPDDDTVSDGATVVIGEGDLIAPTVQITEPAHGATGVDGSALTVSGTAGDDVAVDRVMLHVKNLDTGQSWTGSEWVDAWVWFEASGTDVWSYAFGVGVADGHYQALAWSFDTSSKISAFSQSVFTVGTVSDVDPPTVEITDPAHGATGVDGSALTVSGTAGDDVAV
ncbi:MAG: DUF11 domain-containing protein, partial [Acidimicrobiia bacterium]|nr:DUF11 domain-containing protein [Acidimicrobiia bacterium]